MSTRQGRMNIVVPKETYNGERRLTVLPPSAKVLVEAGHKVFVQAGAGSGIDVSDDHFRAVGAEIISGAAELYARAHNGGMVVKVKAPTPEEFSFMKRLILFCMIHADQNKERLWHMGSQELVGVAMEDIRDDKRQRLVDQTFETGYIGVLYAMQHSLKLPRDMTAVILGYGGVASGAIAACAQLGIKYKIMRRRDLQNIGQWLQDADLLINGIAWPDSEREKRAHLVTREHIRRSRPGMIVLDLSVDFPNPIETIRPTTYMNPYYLDEGRVHISIYGYPGLKPVSSSQGYSEQVAPLALVLANNSGIKNLASCGDLGKYMARAVVDPKQHNWQQYQPESAKAPRIE
jgi:alanine dehydrogenase